MRIILHGYTGRMGRMMIEAVSRSAHEITAMAAYDCPEEKDHCWNSLDHITEQADVLIDFSNHQATEAVLDYAVKHGLPAVICTTGQTEEEKEAVVRAAEMIPVFFSANMSLGIAVLQDLVRKAAAVFPEADIEIVEKHHNQKLDVPSGTALILADAVKQVRTDAVYNIGRSENGKRTKNEIGIHSLRMGSETGTHEIYINTGSECLILTHRAYSRAVFADGALKAAEFLAGKPAGLYTMKDMTGETE